MADRDQVCALHRQNPTWTAKQIADELRCDPGYVRATAQRLNLALPSAIPESIKRLGEAARDAGLTVAEIQRIGVQRERARS